MGAEIKVNSLEEMCDLMCNNQLPKRSKPRYYIFTFGCGMAHAGYYVKVRGTYASARRKMCEKYGDQWSFQYSESEWTKMQNNPDRYWELEKELEVIE